jgi:hypothetical protein
LHLRPTVGIARQELACVFGLVFECLLAVFTTVHNLIDLRVNQRSRLNHLHRPLRLTRSKTNLLQPRRHTRALLRRRRIIPRHSLRDREIDVLNLNAQLRQQATRLLDLGVGFVLHDKSVAAGRLEKRIVHAVKEVVRLAP